MKHPETATVLRSLYHQAICYADRVSFSANVVDDLAGKIAAGDVVHVVWNGTQAIIVARLIGSGVAGRYETHQAWPSPYGLHVSFDSRALEWYWRGRQGDLAYYIVDAATESGGSSYTPYPLVEEGTIHVLQLAHPLYYRVRAVAKDGRCSEWTDWLGPVQAGFQDILLAQVRVSLRDLNMRVEWSLVDNSLSMYADRVEVHYSLDGTDWQTISFAADTLSGEFRVSALKNYYVKARVIDLAGRSCSFCPAEPLLIEPIITPVEPIPYNSDFKLALPGQASDPAIGYQPNGWYSQIVIEQPYPGSEITDVRPWVEYLPIVPPSAWGASVRVVQSNPAGQWILSVSLESAGIANEGIRADLPYYARLVFYSNVVYRDIVASFFLLRDDGHGHVETHELARLQASYQDVYTGSTRTLLSESFTVDADTLAYYGSQVYASIWMNGVYYAQMPGWDHMMGIYVLESGVHVQSVMAIDVVHGGMF